MAFPSAADDYLDKHLDLNELLIKRPAATFFMRYKGPARLGLLTDDMLVVDRSIVPQDGKLVVAVLDGELLVRTFQNKASGEGLEVWGTVLHIIRSV